MDCPLEYKKGESQTNIEITKEADWKRILEIEEEQVKVMCDKILEFKPDLVITEKGVSGALQQMHVVDGRSCSALLCQGECHSNSTRSQDG